MAAPKTTKMLHVNYGWTLIASSTCCFSVATINFQCKGALRHVFVCILCGEVEVASFTIPSLVFVSVCVLGEADP